MKVTTILSKSKVTPDAELEMDSVAYSKRISNRRAFDILMEAQRAWDNMAQFRKNRERAKRYTYGDQWCDPITIDGETITEEEYIVRQGNVPLKNNLISRYVRNVIGVYRSQAKEPTCYARDREEQKLGETMTTVLQCNMQNNQMSELLSNQMKEFCISGLAAVKKTYGWRRGTLDCWTDAVDLNGFFIDGNARDNRGWDIELIGEIHDMSFSELVSEFSHSPEDYLKLREIYRHSHDAKHLAQYASKFGYSRLANYDFLCVNDVNRCRVIEVWRLETKPRYRCHDINTGEIFKCDVEDRELLVDQVNQQRIADGLSFGMLEEDISLIQAEWFLDKYWYRYYLSPYGDILREGETPYDHGEHPYVFKAYPFIDGEIHSFVNDVIDQQRYVNRLVTLYDFIMRASAKGVLLFPEGAQPDNMSMEDIAEEWGKFDGIVYYKPKAGVPPPQQIANKSTNIGIFELLNLQLKLFDDVSGITGALQGKPGHSGMSASLYYQQTQNATMSLLDLLESFGAFVRDGALKDVKNIQQFYDDHRVIKVAGRSETIRYDQEKLGGVEFDLSIIESTATPAYRQFANETLMQLWKAGAISVEQLLEHSDFPFADDLLQSIQSQKEQLQQGQVPEGLSPQLAQQVQAGANPQSVADAYNILRA